MAFNDDEFVVPTPYDSGLTQETFIQGKTKLTITRKEKAPLEESNTTLFLQLTDTGFDSERHGVDIVAIVDASGENLNKLKSTIQFMINKLSSSDRLSIITFAKNGTTRLCPLTQMTEISKAEITKVVHDMGACDGANIFASLEMAAQVLRDRRHAKGRVGAIMVMSDGNSQISEDLRDAAQFGLDHVPIYTFGFGDGCDHKVLKAIAEDTGGMFTNANVENTPSNNLSIMFSDSLGRLLNEDVKNLELTIRELDSKIEKVNVGCYPRSDNDANGSTTIVFGNLYKQEIINLSVELLLPAVSIDNKGKNVLEFTLSYSVGENRLDTCRITVSITRTSQVVVHDDMDDEPILSDEEQVVDQTVSSHPIEEPVVTKIGETNNTGPSKFFKMGEFGKANLAKKIINPVTSYLKIINPYEETKTNEKKGTHVDENVATRETGEAADEDVDKLPEEVNVVDQSQPITNTDGYNTEGINNIPFEETKTEKKKETSTYDNLPESMIVNQPTEDVEPLPKVVHVVNEPEIIDYKMPTSMDLLLMHLKEAVDLITAMQDDLNKFL